MLEKTKRALIVLRVLDGDGNLSLTNIALMAVLVRILMLPTVDLPDLATFLATIVGYHVKRFAAPANAPEDLEPLKSAVASLQTKITALQMSNNLSGRK